MVRIPTLKLIREKKIADLLSSDKPSKRWEASGVLVQDSLLFVVFDDRTEIARLSADLQSGSSNGLVGLVRGGGGYEGVTYNSVKGRYYLLIEAWRHADGRCQARLVEYDGDFNFVKDRPIAFAFESDNKGFEAVAYVRRLDRDFVLALCEGNKCKCGKEGRKPGGGRVQIFEKGKKRWKHFGTIALPKCVPFEDYSGMSIKDGRVAVVSQVNSMLWVGQFDESDWGWRDEGRLYLFPRAKDGSITYGNIEGVAWISPTRVVTVSDRRKKSTQPSKALSGKDQSVHLFDLPGARSG